MPETFPDDRLVLPPSGDQTSPDSAFIRPILQRLKITAGEAVFQHGHKFIRRVATPNALAEMPGF